MATDKQIEAAAREMFSLSWGAQLGLYHWPGDEPQAIPIGVRNSCGDMTLPADDPIVPGGGAAPDKLRKMATQILDAAEAV